jgi:hypothetical protein
MTEIASFGDIARRLVLRLIEAGNGAPEEQKERIMIARLHGHLTDQEAEDWLRLLQLEAA